MITDSKDKEFIRENYMDMTDPELASTLGYSRNEVRSCRRDEDLIKHKRATWSKKELELVKQLYPDTPSDEILSQLDNKNLDQLYRKASNLGVKKTDEFLFAQNQKLAENLKEYGKEYRFEKGHVPVNKGLSQEEYMSPEAIERTKKTRFKKGQKPHNTMFDGAVTIRKDSKGNKYMWIRHSEGEWQEYHRYQYEKHIGPIPEGHLVVFKDGNSLNPDPKNLEAITPAEHANRNRDWEKAMQTMEERGTHGSKNLTDNYVAGMISGHDKEIKEHILKHRPDLIRAARLNYKLKRGIKSATNE